MEIWNLWHAQYWMAGVLKAITAVAAAGTAILLVRLAPQALALPSPSQWTEMKNNLADAISEGKRGAVTPRQSDENLRLLIKGVRDYAIFMLDSTGRITTWNEGAERIKGYSAEEILGVHFSIFYTPADLRTGKPARELLIAEQHGRVEEEGWRVRKDGTQFWANVVITALRDETGLLCGFGKVTRDISYRKKIEESLELQRQELAEKNAQLLVANNELESFSYSVHTTCAPHSEPSTVSVTLCWKITNANQTQRPRITCEVFALQPCAWAISLMTFWLLRGCLGLPCVFQIWTSALS